MKYPKLSFCTPRSSQIFSNRSIPQCCQDGAWWAARQSLHNGGWVPSLNCNLFIQSSERTDDTQNLRRTAQRALDGARRLALFWSPLSRHATGLRPGRLGGQTHDRHRQHLERYRHLPRSLQAARRRRQARHFAGGWFPDRVTGDLAVRGHRQAHHHALPQPAGH